MILEEEIFNGYEVIVGIHQNINHIHNNLLRSFPKKHLNQYLIYSIGKKVYLLEQTLQQFRFMHEENIITQFRNQSNIFNNNIFILKDNYR